MRYIALACDYDGTLAHDGRVSAATIAALERVRASGRKLLLVTGRQLDDLGTVFDRLDLFDRVVAARKDDATLAKIRTEVASFCQKFPMPH
jgi:HAD superfamily hydrolase (TIGR01484 family)